MALAYRNTYLEKVGDLMKYCMELSKTVDEALDDIKRVSKDLRKPESVVDMFRNDAEYVTHIFMSGEVPVEDAQDNLKKLKRYVLTQLAEHYSLIITILKDTQKKINENIEKTLKEIDVELPESAIEEVKKSIDRAMEEVELLAKEL
jgi:hypothetical protein